MTDKYYSPITWTVGPEDSGKQVRTVLERRLGVSRKLLSRLKLTEEGLTLNGGRVYTTALVEEGDELALRMEREQSDDILPQEMPLDIVYEDEYLLLVNKEAGVIVHPTHGHYTGTLANGIVHHWRQKGETVRFRPIHRLDQETSGLVAVAKNPYIHQQLSEQMQRGEIGKSYIAFVFGRPEPSAATIDAPIDRNPDDPHYRIVTPSGYRSVTHYQTLAVYGKEEASKVALQLETGRTHQIRVHMQHIGCALLGDKMYHPAVENQAELRERAEQLITRHCLHAAELSFTHPMTRQQMIFQARLPEDLRLLEHELRKLEQPAQQ
ncbi:RluA family pseudouridine synthase [Paenibacillus sambharensis]|uniref:Pseudouridine synthase n=1 Tax=Paenibacillus sambharensis TaxID=1803190 RepID=A0A2W1LTJ1_9BACL|nr:RluA family pseudouridine synthase [Paenibacillus sambharensis]PZD95101.1 RluA family pseudouridine synthase [Paenibacillus sambharensis]